MQNFGNPDRRRSVKTVNRILRKLGVPIQVASKQRLVQAVQHFEEGDAIALARQVKDAYKRRRFKAIQDKWFRFEEGDYMACPLAVLMVDCFPNFPWKDWTDMDASDIAKDLAMESFGQNAVEGFEHGMDTVGFEYGRRPEYERGFRLGKSVWCEVVLKRNK
jgi:hypothetical protein